MILDGNSLKNLDVLENAQGNIDGTILQLLDHSITPFGKRLLRNWICHPLKSVVQINARLDAVEELLQQQDSISSKKKSF